LNGVPTPLGKFGHEFGAARVAPSPAQFCNFMSGPGALGSRQLQFVRTRTDRLYCSSAQLLLQRGVVRKEIANDPIFLLGPKRITFGRSALK